MAAGREWPGLAGSGRMERASRTGRAGETAVCGTEQHAYTEKADIEIPQNFEIKGS